MLLFQVWPVITCLSIVSSDEIPILEHSGDRNSTHHHKLVLRKTDSILGRIVQGDAATIDKYPWEVSLQRLVPNNDGQYLTEHFCGGSIISKRWVLTAARCNPAFSGKYPQWLPFVIVAGVTDYRNHRNSGAQVFRPLKWISHSDFDHSDVNHNNDIALLKIEGSFKTTKSVQQVAFPAETDLTNGELTSTFQDCEVSGWGKVNGTTLDKVNMQLLDHEQCRKETQSATLDELDNPGELEARLKYLNLNLDSFDSEAKAKEFLATNQSQLNLEGKTCAWVKKASIAGICIGDYGGPLVCKKGSNNQPYLVGVPSFVQTVSNYEENSTKSTCEGDVKKSAAPSVFTNVASFEKWIQTHDIHSGARRGSVLTYTVLCFHVLYFVIFLMLC